MRKRGDGVGGEKSENQGKKRKRDNGKIGKVGKGGIDGGMSYSQSPFTRRLQTFVIPEQSMCDDESNA